MVSRSVKRHKIPWIANGVLYLSETNTETLIVGSPEWFSWLDTAASFAYTDPVGTFTARLETTRTGGKYWKAYRRYQGKLRSFYLGQTKDLTLDMLHNAASQLSPGSAAASESKPDLPMRRKSPRIDLHPFTKFLIPQTPANVYHRPRLFEPFRNQDRSVVWVDAPPSYGKSTLVVDWIASDHPSAGWISLDESDNDPVPFWSAIAIGLDSIQSGYVFRDLSLLQSVPHLDRHDILPTLINSLDKWLENLSPQQPVVLVLDDFDKITNPSIHSDLSAFIARMPTQFRLVILSRSSCPLQLGHLRLQNRFADIDVQDLIFKRTELEELIKQCLDRELPAEEVDQLMQLTQGWTGAIQLAISNLQSGQSFQSVVESLSGNHSKIISSLFEDFLSKQPEPVIQFLLVSSVLERLSADICDRLLTEGQRRKEDLLSSLERRRPPSRSQTLLNYLVKHNVFIFPEDSQGDWLRYHPLFAQYLRSRLEEKSKRLMPRLHMLAARWLTEHNYYQEAVQHALSIENDEYVAELIEMGARVALDQGKYRMVKAWLQVFPSGVIKKDPRLNLLAAVIHTVYGQLDEAQTALNNFEIDMGFRDNKLPGYQNMTLLWEILHAYLNARINQDIHSTIKQIIHLSRVITEDQYSLDFAARIVLLDLYKRADAPVKAEITASNLARVSQKAENARSYFYGIAEVARAQMDLGKLSWAQLTLEHASRQARALNAEADFDEVTCSVAAHLAYEHNDFEKAWDLLSHRMVAGWEETGPPVQNGLSLLVLCQLHMAQGDYQLADQTLDQVDTLFGSLDHPLTKPLAALRTEICLRQVQQDENPDYTQTSVASWAVRIPEQNQVNDKYLLHETIWPSHLTRARVRLAEGKPHEALTEVEMMRGKLETAQAKGKLIQVLGLQAIIQETLGQHQDALNTLLQALTWGEPEGFVRSIIDWEKPISTLLMSVREELRIPLRMNRYITKLLGLLQPNESLANAYSQASPNIHLTMTEKKVLYKLSEGYSTAEIAKDLIVSENTAKTHISHILRKLNVTSRAQAVHRAYELILLD